MFGASFVLWWHLYVWLMLSLVALCLPSILSLLHGSLLPISLVGFLFCLLVPDTVSCSVQLFSVICLLNSLFNAFVSNFFCTVLFPAYL